jgi:hypothetical protein
VQQLGEPFIKQPVPIPIELGSQRRLLRTVGRHMVVDFNLVKVFGQVVFVLNKPIYHKPKRWELATTVTDHLLVQQIRVQRLQPQGLEPSEDCTHPQIQLGPGVARI